MPKNTLKIGILGLTLLLPVLVYLFLKFFGQNHYSLPTYFPVNIVDKTVAGQLVSDTTFHTIPDFKAVDQYAKTIVGADFQNDILIVNFFFTKCPGICPKMSSQLSRVQESFIKNPEVKLISFSVDPLYDQPNILKVYGDKFGAIDGKWYLATTNSQIDVFNLGFYGFKVPSDTVDKFLHSEKILLVDKEKHVRGFYTGTEQKDIDRLITEVDILLYEYKNSTQK